MQISAFIQSDIYDVKEHLVTATFYHKVFNNLLVLKVCVGMTVSYYHSKLLLNVHKID